MKGPGPSTTWSRRLTRETAILWCIVAATAIVYLNCLRNEFVLDDVIQIIKNPDLPHWSFLWKAFTRNEFWYSDANFVQGYQSRNYRPIILVWFWVNYHLFGLHPAPWHWTIVTAHLVAVWLVFKIARRLTGESTPALIAAAIFGLIPIHVGSVVWMACCGIVLGSTMILGAFYTLIRDDNPSRSSWMLALVLYAGALQCHESMAVFPGIVAAYGFIFADEPALTARIRRAVRWTAPFAAEVLIYFVVRKLVLGFFIRNPNDVDNLLTATQAVLTVPAVLATYLTLLAAPWRTLPNHRMFPVSSIESPHFWIPLIALALFVSSYIFFAVRSRERRFYLFCGAWIAVTMVPMMALRSLPHIVQDYTLYMPSVGWSVIVGAVVSGIASHTVPVRRVAFACTVAMLAIYAIALWNAQSYWRNDVAAARGYVEGFPESVRWHWALATYLDRGGDHAGSEQEIRTSIALEPDNTGIMHPSASQLHHYLGELLARRGDVAGAELEFATSVSMAEADDNEALPSVDLATEHKDVGLYDHGLYEAAKGHTDKAIREMNEALSRMKGNPSADDGPIALRYVKLAELYDSLGEQAKVESLLKHVDSMSVGELAVGLARAKISLNHGDKAGAERILLDLSERYPTDHEVLMMLGDLEFDSQHYEEALECYQRAGGGWFGGAPEHLGMAKSLHAMGRNREAADQCRMASALDPHNKRLQFSCAQIGSN